LGELFVTRDGARTWEQRYTELAEPSGVAASRGARWRTRGIDVTTSWHHYVDPFEPKVRYVTHSDIGLTRSDDGGRTWRHALGGAPWTNSVYALAFDPEIAGTIWAVASQQHDIPHWTQLEGPSARGSGGLMVTRDGAQSWSKIGGGLPDAP